MIRIVKKKHFKDTLIISQVVDALTKGGLVVIPSDTVYGFALDATNKSAVEKLIAFKQRPKGKPISVFVRDLSHADRIAYINESQRQLLQRIFPGPFTLVLKSKPKVVVRQLLSEDESIGVRIVDEPFVNYVLERFKKPITATSANLSGRGTHYSIPAFLKTLSVKKKQMIDLIVDWGVLPHRLPSTVIDVRGGSIKTIRKGQMMVDRLHISYKSFSETDTRGIGEILIKKHLNNTYKAPLIFLIEGELGVGKTQLVKGIAKYLGVTRIVSPTFVVYYEYPVSRKDVTHFYHADLYAIERSEEFGHLGFEKLATSRTVMCIEWGEKSSVIIDALLKKGTLIYIKMDYLDEKNRVIHVYDTIQEEKKYANSGN